MFGTVDENGIIRFKNDDINKCRTFLRSLGLDVSITGWSSPDMRGMLECVNGKWHCAAWKTAEASQTVDLPNAGNAVKLSLVS